jgi:hypothetical protein
MIKAVAKGKRLKDDTPVTSILLGLSDENLRRLREDMPIAIDGREIGMPDIDVVIFAGRTEDEMLALLKRAGAIER